MAFSDKECIQINQALFSLTQAYSARLIKSEQQQATNLTLSDRAVLMVLGQFSPINSRKLSELMNINPGTISVYVQRLVSKGLVRKTQDEEDLRNWLLTLTKAGQKSYQETIAGAVAYTRDFLSVLEESEQKTLRKLLLKVSHNLGFGWQ